MSSVQTSIVNPDSQNATNEAIGQGQPARSAQHKNYKGFVAGVFSGISKLSGTYGRAPGSFAEEGNANLVW